MKPASSVPEAEIPPHHAEATARMSVNTGHVQAAQFAVLASTAAVCPLVFSRWTFDVFNITELTLLWLGVVIAGALRLVTLVAGERPAFPALWPIVACYIGVLTLTALTSRAPVVSFFGNYGRFGGLVTSLAVIALAWMLWERAAGRPDRQHVLVMSLACSSLAGAVYLIVQELGVDTVEWLQPDGLSPNHSPGVLGNSNFSGAHVAMGVGPTVWLAVRASGRARILWVGTLAVCLAGVAVSQSRGAMLATAVTLLVAASLVRLGLRRLAMAAAIAVALLGVVALATSNNGVSDLVDPTTSDERVDLWTVALRGAPDHLVVGGGPDLYLVTFTEHAGGELEGVFADEPHNVVLDHLDGSGLLGAAAWLAVLGATVATARRAQRELVAPWLLLGVAYLVQAMVSIDAVPLLLWAWVAVAGVAGAAAPSPPPPKRDRVGVAAIAAATAVAIVGCAFVAQPFRADMAYRRAIEASNAGDTVAARIQLRQAIDRHPWEPRYRARLGLELWGALDLSDPDQAAAVRAPLLDALDLFPDDPSANAWLAGVDARIAAIEASAATGG